MRAHFGGGPVQPGSGGEMPSDYAFSPTLLLDHAECVVAALAAVSGVGPTKLERYGAAVLAIMKEALV